MLALAGNFHFFGSRIAASVAAVLFTVANCAQARLVGASFCFLFCHRNLLLFLMMVSGYGWKRAGSAHPGLAGWRRTRKAQVGIVTAECFESQTVKLDPEISLGLRRAKRWAT
jgi:hypothetical protein